MLLTAKYRILWPELPRPRWMVVTLGLDWWNCTHSEIHPASETHDFFVSDASWKVCSSVTGVQCPISGSRHIRVYSRPTLGLYTQCTSVRQTKLLAICHASCLGPSLAPSGHTVVGHGLVWSHDQHRTGCPIYRPMEAVHPRDNAHDKNRNWPSKQRVHV